jgi:hypothetical protein
MNRLTFTTADAGSPPPDPRKHVKYTQGMVLGVADFTQDFAYLSNLEQSLARDAIGYGTLSGLNVALTPKDGDTVISVSPGVAKTGRGQFVRVAQAQCAKLGAWLELDATKKKLAELGLTAAGDFTAYVVLCYRDCPTDELPVPGEPCRCDDETMAPSRIIDDFRLELTLTPPPQLEENIVRKFVTWLRAIEIGDESPPGDPDAFLHSIRDAFTFIPSPPESPSEFFFASPPAELRIPRDLVCEWMRAAMRLWVTELRPIWQAQCAPRSACGCADPCGCHGTGAEPEGMACECVLLAEIHLGGSPRSATLDETRRPFLVHLRMLQELLLCGPCICGGERGELGSPPSVGPVPVPDDGALVAENVFSPGGSTPDPGISPGFARADHTHGLPRDPIPPHTSSNNDHANHLIAGDVTGTLLSSRVMRLRGVPVNTPVTTDGNILVVRGGGLSWEAPSGGIQGEFVEHLREEGRYFIIAAGHVDLRDAPFLVQPNYHKLQVTRVGQNDFLLTYGIRPTGDPIKGYVKPVEEPVEHTYMVKGTSFGHQAAFLHVVEFSPEGIRVRFFGVPENMPPERVVIEISLFGRLG